MIKETRRETGANGLSKWGLGEGYWELMKYLGVIISLLLADEVINTVCLHLETSEFWSWGSCCFFLLDVVLWCWLSVVCSLENDLRTKVWLILSIIDVLVHYVCPWMVHSLWKTRDTKSKGTKGQPMLHFKKNKKNISIHWYTPGQNILVSVVCCVFCFFLYLTSLY